MEKAKFYIVPSKTHKGEKYRLRYIAGKGWRCECRGFVFNERKIGYCQHILDKLMESGK